jgi:AAA family ATP:ADP antiporter
MAFRLVFQNQYLRSIAVFSLLFTFVKTNGDYLLARLVKDAAASAEASGSTEGFIASFYAQYFFYVDVVSLLIQAFVVSRVVKYLGTKWAFHVLPALALLDATASALLPLLSIVRVGKLLESATDYSLNNTVRNLLWLPTTRRDKYLAKQAVDTFFVRLGDVSSAGLVFFGGHLLGWGVVPFAGCNVALTLGWLGLARVIMRQRSALNGAQPQ